MVGWGPVKGQKCWKRKSPRPCHPSSQQGKSTYRTPACGSKPQKDVHLHPGTSDYEITPLLGACCYSCLYDTVGLTVVQALKADGIFQPATCSQRGRERGFLEDGGAVSQGMQVA